MHPFPSPDPAPDEPCTPHGDHDPDQPCTPRRDHDPDEPSTPRGDHDPDEPRTPHGDHDPDELAVVARNLVELTGLVPELDPPVVVGLSSTTDEVAVRPLDGPDPVADLVGATVPEDWDALALVATGRTYALAEGPLDAARARRGATTGRVLFVHVVGRRGASAAVVQPFDGEIHPLPSAPGEPTGRADDVLRRMLGLPTAPASHDVGELWALQWLDAVTAELHRRTPGHDLRWPEVARLHPAAHIAGRDPLLGSLVVPALARLGRAFANVTTWSYLRRDCARGRWEVEGITADAAAWMDDGMFSRWTLQVFPFLDDYLEGLEGALAPVVLDEVRATLEAWGLT